MKKKRERILKITYIFIILITIIVLGIYVVPQLKNHDFFNDLIATASVVIALVSAILIVLQLYDAKKIQEAEFVLNLNQSFVENETYASVYTRLEKMNALREADPEAEITETIERIETSNYLTFFEAIYLLLQQKVITMKILDDLFAYRFFLAVHSEVFQEKKLVASPYNFRNIYYLEHIWIEYRKENNLSIFREDMSLKNSCERAGKKDIYEQIIKGSKLTR